MKILVDSSGLDRGPMTVINAAKRAKDNFNIEVAVIGDAKIKKDVEDRGLLYVQCESYITPNDDNPALAIRKKKDSSIVIGLNLLKQGEVDAFVSGGSTGAVLAGGMLIVGRINGVKRAALTAVIPTMKGKLILTDIGANVDSTPEMLYSFAIMADKYAESILKIKNPRISLLNNGAEEHKGNNLTKETYQLLKNSNLNFVGNIEARYLFDGDTDIIIMDGFYGNILLKTLEGEFRFIKYLLKTAAKASLTVKLGLSLAMGGLKKKMQVLDSSKYGGVPLLGLKKPVIKAHGSSNEDAIYNSIIVAKDSIETGMIQNIEEAFKGE